MYFLDATELLSIEILMLSSYFSPEASMSVCCRRLFCTAWGHVFCPLSKDGRLFVSRRLKMYYFYGKINWGHADYPLYGGSQYLRESVMGGFTVQNFLKFNDPNTRDS